VYGGGMYHIMAAGHQQRGIIMAKEAAAWWHDV